MKRKLAYQVCYAIAALWALPQAASAAGIATVVDVVNEGYRTPPGADEVTAKTADELVQNEGLRTEEESVIAVKFVDGSTLSVEESSEMVLSDYVFDGAASSGLINLNNGLFHFTSGGQGDQGVRLRTPVATIGVRGTEFLVHVDGDDATIIDILSGAVSAQPNGTGKEITCFEGQSILVAGADEDALLVVELFRAVDARADLDLLLDEEVELVVGHERHRLPRCHIGVVIQPLCGYAARSLIGNTFHIIDELLV